MGLQRRVLILVVLRIILGGFWFEHSHAKWGWFESGELENRFRRYNEDAQGIRKLYLEKFCLPFSRILLYLVVLGELAVGLSFLLGYLTKRAAWGGAFMAFNFIFAQGRLLSWDLIGNPYGPVLITAMMVAAYAGGESLFSLSRLIRSDLSADT